MDDAFVQSKRDEIKDKLRQNFDGRIVRKDLKKKIKEGANVPVYVLEFLLGQYDRQRLPTCFTIWEEKRWVWWAYGIVWLLMRWLVFVLRIKMAFRL